MNAVALAVVEDAAPPRPLNKRELAKAGTKAKLLMHARYLFANQGYGPVTMRAIARAVGGSTGAIFSCWPDKDALWREAMGGEPPDYGMAEAAARIEAMLPGWTWAALKVRVGYNATLMPRGYDPTVAGGPRLVAAAGVTAGEALLLALFRALEQEAQQ